MPALIQVCVVIMTLALIGIVLMQIRAMGHLTKAAEEFSQVAKTVRSSAVQLDVATHEARELITSVRDCIPPVQRVVSRLESVGNRAADLSNTILDEVELPVFTAAAVARGVRSGAGHLVKQLLNRFSPRPPLNGGHHHE